MDRFLSSEVEDIMCDQVILTAELQVLCLKSMAVKKMEVIYTLLAKTLLPALIGLYYAYMRSQKILVEILRTHVLPTILEFLSSGVARSMSPIHRSIKRFPIPTSSIKLQETHKVYRYLLPSVFANVANGVSRSLASVQRGIAIPLSFTHKIPTERDPEVDNKPEKSVECLVLNDPAEAKVDVIFIHGLHGSLVKTWRQGDWRHEGHRLWKQKVERRLSADNIERAPQHKVSFKRSESDPCYVHHEKMQEETENVDLMKESNHDKLKEMKHYSNCWPRDWLPVDCPNARVIALNYSTDPYLWRPVWIKKRNRTSMTQRSKEMIGHLLELGVGKNPIVWVGHSKGGLFIKQIIVDAFDNRENLNIRNIYKQTRSILFYSVPHKGSLLADLTLPFLIRRSTELMEIRRNCHFVLDLHKKFLEIVKTSKVQPEVFSFIETSFTFMSFVYLKIVAFESADPRIGKVCGVPLDHREICKPAARDCFLYHELVFLIQNVIDKS